MFSIFLIFGLRYGYRGCRSSTGGVGLAPSMIAGFSNCSVVSIRIGIFGAPVFLELDTVVLGNCCAVLFLPYLTRLLPSDHSDKVCPSVGGVC